MWRTRRLPLTTSRSTEVMPVKSARVIAALVGIAIEVVWLPLLAGGIASLRRRGRFGVADFLIVTGPYAQVRHPLYAGLSMTLVGIGFIFGLWRLAVGGFCWLVVTLFWSIPEDRRLSRRFGREYARYRTTTPGFIPRIRPATPRVASTRPRGSRSDARCRGASPESHLTRRNPRDLHRAVPR